MKLEIQKKMTQKMRMLLAFLGALVITALYFLWAYSAFPFLYDINDDVAMRNVAAGVITGSPDAHLIHIKYVLGLVISGLYAAAPGFDWYGIVMVGIVCLSLLILLYRGLEMRRSLLWKMGYVILTLLFFTCFGLKHMVCFQWTVAAGLAGGAGLFLFFTCQEGNGFQAWVEEGVSAFLILLSLCIRDDVFLLVLPAAALLFWWRYGSFQKGKLPLRLEHWQVLTGLLGGMVLILGVEAFAYRSPAWKEFLAYNQDREAIMDFYGIPTYEEDTEFYQSLGMSENEVVNLHRYSLYLVDGIYSEKMHALAENARGLYLEENPPVERLQKGLTKVYENLFDPAVTPTMAFMFLLLTASWIAASGPVKEKQKQREKQMEKQRDSRSLLAAVTLLYAAYWLYLAYRGRVVDRVVYTLLFLQIFTYAGIFLEGLPLLEAAGQQSQEGAGWKSQGGACWQVPWKAGWQSGCMTLLLMFILLLICQGQIRELRADSESRRDYNQQFLEINRYMAEHMENVYFMTTFSIETYTDNFTLRRDFDFTNLLSVGGWHSFSELENEKIEKLGIGGQTMEHAMLTEENVYVISCVNVDYMDRYFTGKYGEAYLGRKETDVQIYGDTEFTVYQFSIEE